jgi:hypothetical protein
VDKSGELSTVVVGHVAPMAKRFEVAEIVPPVRRVLPLNDVVDLLACEPAAVARRVSHEPQATDALPSAA